MLLGLVAGCGGGQPESEEAVAFLCGEPLSVGGLQQYLDANLVLEEGKGVRRSEMDAIKSRLFDAFVEERILLMEAERRGIEVSDLEVEAYIGVGREIDESAVTQTRWREVRRRLMIQKLHEEISRNLPRLPEEAVLSHLDAHRERLIPESRLQLRALLVPSRERAETISREIGRRRMTFNEAVVAHGAEGQGAAITVALDSLWEDHRAALSDLKPGQVSRPVEMNGEVYLFQLVARLDGESADEEHLLKLARASLEEQQRRAAHVALLAKLEKKTDIRLKLHKLPFEYVPES